MVLLVAFGVLVYLVAFVVTARLWFCHYSDGPWRSLQAGIGWPATLAILGVVLLVEWSEKVDLGDQLVRFLMKTVFRGLDEEDE